MSKPNFKKLALLGITGGIAVCSSASAAEIINSSNAHQFLAGGCNGKSGCNGAVAYQPYSGCNARQSQSYYNNAPQGQPYMPQGGCNAMPQDGNYTAYQPYQPQHSCNAQPQNSYAPRQSGCNGQRPQGSCNASPMAQGSCNARTPTNGNQRSVTQWESNGSNRVTAMEATTAKMTEDEQALSQLDEEGKSIYRGLDPAGKAMANKAINQASTPQEKTQAVKDVAQKLSEKRAKPGASRY